MILSSSNALYCQNPFCPKSKKVFSNRAAYSMHVDRSPACYVYIVTQMQGGVPHGRSSQQEHRVHEDSDVKWRSNKMPSSLRRHEVCTTLYRASISNSIQYTLLLVSNTTLVHWPCTVLGYTGRLVIQ